MTGDVGFLGDSRGGHPSAVHLRVSSRLEAEKTQEKITKNTSFPRNREPRFSRGVPAGALLSPEQADSVAPCAGVDTTLFY